MPVNKLVPINSLEGEFVGLFQVRLGPSWHCFTIPWMWHRGGWRQGWVPHYGRQITIRKIRWHWEEASSLLAWPGEVLITLQLSILKGWEGITRVILVLRRGAQYSLYPPSTTSSPHTNYGGGAFPDCVGCLCSSQTWKLLATFWFISSDHVDDLKVLRSVPNVLKWFPINDSLVYFW